MSRFELDWEGLRERLARKEGPAYWRSLEELADAPEVSALIAREFPDWEAPLDRRRFLQLMGASLALAGLSACARPASKIVPYVRQPEAVVPGKPLFFATAMPLGGYGTGLLVESHTGRPTKIEGNPDHPASLGAASAIAQASILGLYDPDRSNVVLKDGAIASWEGFLQVVTGELATKLAAKGAGLRLLTETVTSPTLAGQIATFLKRFPEARWHQYEPLSLGGAQAGTRLAYGQALDTLHRLDQAKVILSLEADFLAEGPASLREAHDFAAGRRVTAPGDAMNRLYVVEASPTLTGAMADHRLALAPSAIPAFAIALAERLGVPLPPGSTPLPTGLDPRWLDALVQDLVSHRGQSAVMACAHLSPQVQALVHAMNEKLGNVGRTVLHTAPVAARAEEPIASMRELVAAMEAGTVDVLVILGGNPAYTAPADVPFAEALLKVRQSVHLSLYEDETSALCHWHLPEAHYLEAWGDVRAFDGTVSLVQPLIAPLYGGKSAIEVLGVLNGAPRADGLQFVRSEWQRRHPGPDFETFWTRALQAGVLPGTAEPPKAGLKVATERLVRPVLAKTSGFEVIFRADPTVYDGRFANNGWLQELPKPLTLLTWDNAALLAPETAARLSLSNGDVVELRYKGRIMRAPVWVMPGHAPEAVTLPLGYGRTRSGKVGTGIGFDAYRLRTAEAPWTDGGLELKKTGERYALASTQHHHDMAAREPVRTGTLDGFRADPAFAHDDPLRLTSLYPEKASEGHAWGMAIDLNVCIGCNACMTACQAENNVPVVGKEQVERNREMHWLRVDRYYQGPLDDPQTVFQPVPCMHCEKAPCELVCPTAATVHSTEGLNDMTYNRCIGTRYCSNNCPYKVRRFNFVEYADFKTPSLEPMRNPDVSVRSRGVMEKCTYCVQRINAARIEAKVEGRPIRDGEVVTACQATCPTRAIVFGDLNDPQSEVSKRKAEPLNYALLGELNTRPRTTYLAKLRNPNPAIEAL
ncbi:TAT-variant-translocated molybdopterin oxidoreductase [bacterium]|nr:TAT-variant-translocated molybdopterin oxidoreductase [bacterium]